MLSIVIFMFISSVNISDIVVHYHQKGHNFKTTLANYEQIPYILSNERLDPVKDSSLSKRPIYRFLYYYRTPPAAGGLRWSNSYEAAIRLTSDRVSAYLGYKIVELFLFSPTYRGHATWCYAKIYGAGTSRTPGRLLTQSRHHYEDRVGWLFFPLFDTLFIDEPQEIWASLFVLLSDPTVDFVGMDSGPAIPGRGAWLFTGGEWVDVTTRFHANWIIGLVLTPAGDSLDPIPPNYLRAYSDYTTPNSINVAWRDPLHYVNGDTLTDFRIEIRVASENSGDTILVDTVPAGVERYTVTGLIEGELYTIFLRTIDANDSTSVFVKIRRYSGGSPYPATPGNFRAVAIDDTTLALSWINPYTQSDGSPIDDLAGINIYVDGNFFETYPTTQPRVNITHYIRVTPSRHTVYITAIDNETPQHESAPTETLDATTNVHANVPDGYGYTFIDSDHPDGPDFIWVDATNGTPYHLRNGEDVLIALPFEFPFYDQNLTQIRLGPEGYISSSRAVDRLNIPLPDTTKNNIIAPFWDNLCAADNGAIYTYYDSTGTGAFVIEWVNFVRNLSPGEYTFEVLLYPDGNIVFSYLIARRYLNFSTIGIQGGYGFNGYYQQYAYHGEPTEPHDSLSILFIRPSLEYDVGISRINGVGGDYLVGDVITPEVTVRNLGHSNETFAVVAEIYHDSVIYYSDTVNISNLRIGDSREITFPDFTIDSPNSYTFRAYIHGQRDNNPDNDTLELRFYVYDAIEDFESSDGGYIPDPLSGGWEWGTPTWGFIEPHSGNKVWGTLLGGYYPQHVDWTLTKDFIATKDNPIYSFWYLSRIYAPYDGGNVSLSLDGGNTWVLLIPENGYPCDSVLALGEPGFCGDSEGWKRAIFHLDGISSGSNFKIKLRFASSAPSSVHYPGWYVDDASLIGLLPSISESPVQNRLSFNLLGSSVNPISSVADIMFSVPRKTAVKIELYDVAGRRLTTLAEGEFDAGVHTVRLNASRFTNGIYFVRMTAGDFSAVRKVTVLR